MQSRARSHRFISHRNPLLDIGGGNFNTVCRPAGFRVPNSCAGVLFKRVWARAIHRSVRFETGVIITGQVRTFFPTFIIMKGKSSLYSRLCSSSTSFSNFCSGGKSSSRPIHPGRRLFYHDGIYTTSMASLLSPDHDYGSQNRSLYFWSLFDIGHEDYDNRFREELSSWASLYIS